ncbi:amino acid adenylation domain-containing protein, partial [Flavobacterium nitrogenifigens]
KSDMENSQNQLTVESIEVFEQTNYDFNIAILPSSSSLIVELKYNANIYDAQLIKKITHHVFNLVKGFSVHKTSALSSLDYLTLEEEKELLVGFNGVTLEPLTDYTLVDLFEEQVERTPNNVAVVFEQTQLTYQELNEKSNQLAYYLRENYAIRADDLIGIKMDRTENMIITILGILKSGAAYVPIDVNYPEDRIIYIEEDSSCKAVIDDNILENFTKVQDKFSKENIAKISTANDLAYLIYTSGSTGKPKGVMVENKNAVELINWSRFEFDSSKFEVMYATTSYCFDMSVYEIFYTLSIGKKIRVLRNALEIKDYINKESKIVLDTVPSVIRKLLEDNLDLKNIVFINMGGEIVPLDIVKKLPTEKIEVRNLYGPSEDTTYSTCYLIQNKEYKTIPIGKPLSNTQIYILDDSFRPLPIGVTGKVYISGAGLSRGYQNRAELTQEKFILNPFIEGERMYDTGDLGRWLLDGNIEYIGRKDQQVKIRGFRIELEEIETAILQYSQDLKQVVVEAKESNHEKVLIAYFTASESIDKSELRAYLQGKLPDYMVPGFYIELDELPLNPNGKIDRKALPGVEGEDLIRGEYVLPKNKKEEELVAIWQEVLGIERVGITDNFFELGGHSLSVAQVVNRIHKQFGKTITIKLFFANPTIEELSKELQDSEYIAIPKAPESESYPLTASQRGLWIMSQLEGGSLAYNMPGAVLLKGNIDTNKFEESFKLLLQRHEILRTYFKADNEGNIRQYIIPTEQLDFKISSEDFSFAENQQEAIATYIKARKHEIFDLEQAPLLRASLLKLKEQEYVFFLSMHHIIGDGWSMELLVSEVVEAYNRLIQGKKVDFPELGIQYKDYAVWLNGALQQAKNQASEAYWLNQFAGELPVLDLPSFKTRPLVKTYNGANISHHFSQAFLEELKAFSKAQDVTLFMTLMAGINTLLYKYSGQNDIIVGTSIAGREHPDLENQLGLYLNTLAIRTRFEPDGSFLDLVSAQKNTLLGAYEHQNYPFDALVGKLNLQRDPSRSALFDVSIVLQNQSQLNNLKGEELRDLEMEPYEFSSATAQFDIIFTFAESDGLSLMISYNTDIYEEYLIERMFTHFENLIRESIEQPERLMKEIDYLTFEEQNQLLTAFNDTNTAYPREKTIVDLFEEQVRKTPNNIAVIFENNKLTYQELNEKSNQLAYYLRENYAIKPDDLVGVKLAKSDKMIVALLGVLKSGAAYLPIDVNYPQDRITYIEEDCKCKIVLDEEEMMLCNLERYKYGKENPDPINQSGDLAYVIYTSGSTGQPKGVMVEHSSNVNMSLDQIKTFGVTQNDKVVWFASVAFDASISEIMMSLYSGAALCIPGEETIKDKEEFVQFLKATQSTVVTFPPSYLALLSNEDISGLRCIITAGESAD